MPPWIGSSKSLHQFPELHGRHATCLVFFARPHSSLVIGVRGPSPKENKYFRCEVCTRLQLPVEWTVTAEFSVDVAGKERVRVADPPAGVLVECSAVGFLDAEGMRSYTEGDVRLREILENL